MVYEEKVKDHYHEIYKWKARLNVHGGKQEKGVHFWETPQAPVETLLYMKVPTKQGLHDGKR